MLPLIEENREKVALACRRLGVERLDLFGSAARNDFDDKQSDLDFVVRFVMPHDRGYADRYLELAEALESCFSRRVDLLTERSLRNPILKQAISMDRQTLYES
jgi:predicted nucleotidyltransferase